MTPEHQEIIDRVMKDGYFAARATLRTFQSADEKKAMSLSEGRPLMPMLHDTRLYKCLEMLARIAEGDHTVERGDCLMCLLVVEEAFYLPLLRDAQPRPYKMTPKSVLRRLPIGDFMIAAQDALDAHVLPDTLGVSVSA